VARRLFTSESVTEGHPDKMADQISDAILDAMLKDDPGSHVAVETLITTGQVHVAGEVTTDTYVDSPRTSPRASWTRLNTGRARAHPSSTARAPAIRA